MILTALNKPALFPLIALTITSCREMFPYEDGERAKDER